MFASNLAIRSDINRECDRQELNTYASVMDTKLYPNLKSKESLTMNDFITAWQEFERTYFINHGSGADEFAERLLDNAVSQDERMMFAAARYIDSFKSQIP